MKRYAAKAIFQIKLTFQDGRKPATFFEVRILNTEARSLDVARRKLTRLCEADQWSVRPVSEYKSQSQEFLGFAAMDDITFMDAHEAWFEFVDEKPRLLPAAKPRRPA